MTRREYAVVYGQILDRHLADVDPPTAAPGVVAGGTAAEMLTCMGMVGWRVVHVAGDRGGYVWTMEREVPS